MQLRRLLVALTATVAATLVVPLGPLPTADAVTHVTQDRCRSGRVALTFDDGPSTTTQAIADTLRRRGVPATFFMVGSKVAAHPEIARYVAEQGFTIGNHTWDHNDLTDLSRRQVRSQLARTRAALVAAGVSPSRWVRPPYGAADDRVKRLLARLGLHTAFWTVDSKDWTGLSPRRIRTGVLADVESRGRRGSVVLHHDGVANSPATLAALPREIDRLRADGYCFVPLEQADPGTY